MINYIIIALISFGVSFVLSVIITNAVNHYVNSRSGFSSINGENTWYDDYKALSDKIFRIKLMANDLSEDLDNKNIATEAKIEAMKLIIAKIKRL